ncbi:BACON domain-containing protein [Gelidibacter maritimus]|uniref:BACON domain-containing protein n=1 Tax=Gelidibacter maritimus TaxID=2761487 RepID=A0A7W2R277_9FLAO|nr:BACON domain-containing protein [Gelidibacter maritimus]MBA6151526.1 BACON domain-containing protein [Gelidibacter maritimus]
MKKIIVLVMIFATATSVLAQTPLVAGDNCFDNGDYVCAQKKYQDAMDTASGRDKQIAEIRYSRANSCNNWLTVANRAFNNNSYESAKENYQWVLNENPNDNYAKSQLEKCISALKAVIKLSVSKESLTFSPLGGMDRIFVNTNATSYSVRNIPSWCTVQKFDSYFDITYTPNTGISPRTGLYKITAGDKEVEIYASQPVPPKKQEITLSVSKENIRLNEVVKSIIIDVNTNSSDYQITNLPSWCRVKSKYHNWFSLECEANYNSYSREDWFYVNAGNKSVRINLHQSGSTKKSSFPVKKRKEKSIKRSLGSFSSLGIQSGEIAYLGLLYESGGRRTVGFHISARTSLITENNIWNGGEPINKTEIQLGPNFKISKRLYLNIGGGYGHIGDVDSITNFDNMEELGYYVGTAGLMIRLSRVVNINGGVSFMNIDKDFDNPEITFGISFNLKGKNRY